MTKKNAVFGHAQTGRKSRSIVSRRIWKSRSFVSRRNEVWIFFFSKKQILVSLTPKHRAHLRPPGRTERSGNAAAVSAGRSMRGVGAGNLPGRLAGGGAAGAGERRRRYFRAAKQGLFGRRDATAYTGGPPAKRVPRCRVWHAPALRPMGSPAGAGCPARSGQTPTDATVLRMPGPCE